MLLHLLTTKAAVTHAWLTLTWQTRFVRQAYPGFWHSRTLDSRSVPHFEPLKTAKLPVKTTKMPKACTEWFAKRRGHVPPQQGSVYRVTAIWLLWACPQVTTEVRRGLILGSQINSEIINAYWRLTRGRTLRRQSVNVTVKYSVSYTQLRHRWW